MSRRKNRIFQLRGFSNSFWRAFRCGGFHLDEFSEPTPHGPLRYNNRLLSSHEALSGKRVPLTKQTNPLAAARRLKTSARIDSMERKAMCASSAKRDTTSTPESVTASTSFSASAVFKIESRTIHIVHGDLSSSHAD